MKSIKSKILLWIIILSVVPAYTVGIVSTIISYNSNMNSAKSEMQTLCNEFSKRLKNNFDSYLNIAELSGATFDLTFASFPNDLVRQKNVIDDVAKRHGLEAANIIDANGVGRYDGNDYGGNPCFQIAMSGESSISDPLISPATGNLAVAFYAPLWKDGVVGSNVIGVVRFETPSSYLAEVVQDVNVEGQGGGYVVNGNGAIVLYPDTNVVASGYNIVDQAKNETSRAVYSRLIEKTANGESDNDEYYNSQNNQEMLVAYAPIDINANGWSIVLEVSKSHYMDEIISTAIITIVMILVFVAICVLVGTLVSSQIVKPIRACSERMKTLVAGDLSSPTYKTDAKDETGVLSKSTEGLVKKLKRIIDDVERILTAMAEGKLNVDTDLNASAYVGDFSELNNAIKRISVDLCSAMGDIENTAAQVSSGSEQVSAGAQGLSQGATQQASSIEELAATISEISSKTSENLEDCIEAKESVDETARLLQEAHVQMTSMTDTMSRISNASDNIVKIIKAIEDIAFQTNILALNAAVEAAKAGEAGKGFAVVAEEVRNLAAKSQDAVKSTAALIGESGNAVQEGTRISGETAATLEKVIDSCNKVIDIVTKVADASNMQAVSIQQVTIGIDQISAVVQNNSATAEQSAAISEELNNHAQLLKDLVGRFEISDEESDIELE